jgi:hypothetical protein
LIYRRTIACGIHPKNARRLLIHTKHHLFTFYFFDSNQYYTRVTSTTKEGEQLVQQGFELVGRDESGCLWRKRKTFEEITKEREQEFSGAKS